MPPAISTIESNDRNATFDACGLVAFESLYQATPRDVVTNSIRCGAFTNSASAVATSFLVARPASIVIAAAARALVMSCGKLRRISETFIICPVGAIKNPLLT